MAISRRISRGQFLAGSALSLTQLLTPTSLFAAEVNRNRRLRPSGIVPVPGNPYFMPVGRELKNKLRTPNPFHGDKVSLDQFVLPIAGGVSALAVAMGVRGAQKAGQMCAGQILDNPPVADAVSGNVGKKVHKSVVVATTAAATVVATEATAVAVSSPKTLVLYDTTNIWGWLGELYAIMTGNLASHFGSWDAMPVVSYPSGKLNDYTAVVYIGSTYDEPLPTAFLDDVFNATTTRVIWIGFNIWQLVARQSGFANKYGWTPAGLDFSVVAEIDYKSQKLKRYADNMGGIMNYTGVAANAQVIASCVRSDGTTFPWGISSQNLTYLGECPFVYMSEGDRYLIFCDYLFDVLAPAAVTRRRACVRLEDIDPTYNVTSLKQVASWLSANSIPFGFQVTPRYLDPLGYYNNGAPQSSFLTSNTQMVNAIKYMLSKGGVLMGHGLTHQYSNVINPYTGVTGDDTEFYRILKNTDGSLKYQGPVAEDTTITWAQSRLLSLISDFKGAGLPAPAIHTFPSYAGSKNAYIAASSTFAIRSERVLYFAGLISGAGSVDYNRLAGQYFPYTVKDVYCTLANGNCRVLPDTLGGIGPQPYGTYPARLPADIIADAQRTLVVRDGVASFFFHTYDNISYLQDTVNGIKALGYSFVSPAAL